MPTLTSSFSQAIQELCPQPKLTAWRRALAWYRKEHERVRYHGEYIDSSPGGVNWSFVLDVGAMISGMAAGWRRLFLCRRLE
jgi:hypothetical protein